MKYIIHVASVPVQLACRHHASLISAGVYTNTGREGGAGREEHAQCSLPSPRDDSAPQSSHPPRICTREQAKKGHNKMFGVSNTHSQTPLVSPCYLHGRKFNLNYGRELK